VPVNGR